MTQTPRISFSVISLLSPDFSEVEADGEEKGALPASDTEHIKTAAANITAKTNGKILRLLNSFIPLVINMYFWIFYLAAVNLLALILTVRDKRAAIKGKWRVPESTLMITSAIGGSPVMLLTMLLIRHKTRHIKFMLGIPLIILIQLTAAFLIWRFAYA